MQASLDEPHAGDPAVEQEIRAGGEGRLRGEVAHRFRHFVAGHEASERLPTAQRVHRRGRVGRVGRQPFHPRARDGARRDAVHSDAVTDFVGGHRPGEREYRALGRGVHRSFDESHRRRHRARVHDRTPAGRTHRRQDGGAHGRDAEHVDGEHPLPIRRSGIDDVADRADAGDVAEHVDRAVMADGVGYGLIARGAIRDVEAVGQVETDDDIVVGSEPLGDRAPDSAGRTGDHDHALCHGRYGTGPRPGADADECDGVS